MKIKLVALMTLLSIGIQHLDAQVVNGEDESIKTDEVRFGPKVGFAISSFSGNDFVNINTRLGIYIGGIAEIPAFFQSFYLQPEVLLSLKGADVGPGNLNLYYLQLPLMTKYHITDAFAVELGPQFGFLVSDNGNKDPFNNVNPNGFDFGLNIGGGYRLDENFYFQLRFEAGLSRVLENSDLRNRSVSVGASYLF